MNAARSSDSVDNFVTEGGIRISRERHETPYAGAIENYLDRLDRRLGAVFSSNYEYPGRYTRWDTAIVDPPLMISARGRDMRIEALNGRGKAMLPAIGAALSGLEDAEQVSASPEAIALKIHPPRRPFAEEERTRMPSVFSVLRALVGLFRTAEDANLGLYGAFGYDLAFQFEPVELKIERPADQRDLVLFLPDEILVVDHHAARA